MKTLKSWKGRENINGTHFKLLRCSTNLDGPTENFKDTDREIVNKLNENNLFNDWFSNISA